VRVIGKGDKERRVPLDPDVAALIQTYPFAERPESDCDTLFLVAKGPNRGKPLTPAGLRTIFRYHRVKAEVPAGHPHALRHSFAPHRRRCRPDICAMPGRTFLGLDDGRLHHGRRRSRQSDAARSCRTGVCCCAARELAMSRAVSYRWHLRLRMAEQGMFATTELGPLLAERGVVLSREQVYRLAAGTPERLSLHTLAALCDILECTPSDRSSQWLNLNPASNVSGTKATAAQAVPRELRPKRARIIADTEEPR
jgi:Cro/C1-type HTH DNA-binding domain/Phage integrase family